MTTTTRSTVLNEQIDAVIDRAVRDDRVVGTRVLVSVDGQIVYRRSAGLAEREANQVMPDDPVFLLASVTKPIVTVAALKLMASGALRMDAPVTEYLPDFRPALPDGARPEITVEQLLTHTAGLTYGMDPVGFEQLMEVGGSNGLDQPGMGSAEATERLARVPLQFVPGTAWSYSLGLDVVGWAIEAVVGRRLGEVVGDLITAPLGLTDLGFGVRSPERVPANYVTGTPPARVADGDVLEVNGYRTRFAPSRVLDPSSYHSGGAGMAGTAEDVMGFLEAVRTGRLLDEQEWTEATRPRSASDATNYGPGAPFGLGWRVVVDPVANASPYSPGTIGWGGAYGHDWFVDPRRRLTVVSLTNTAPEGMFGAFPAELRDAVYRSV